MRTDFDVGADTVNRLAALSDFAILDTPPEPDFDEIVQLAAAFCATPIGLVSLVARDRQWFKARLGLEACETPIGQSVCAHGLASSDLLVIPDLTLDPRTRENTLVTGEPGLRFYAGAPLETEDGVRLGMLCVIDYAPRPEGLTSSQAAGLRTLARQVMKLMEARRVLAIRDAAIRNQQALLELGDCLREADSRESIMVAVADVLGRTVSAARAGYARVDLRSGLFAVEHDWRVKGLQSLVGEHPVSSFASTIARLKSGESVVTANIPAAHWLESDLDAYREIGVRAQIKAPLIVNGELVGVVFVHDVGPRTWTKEEIDFVHVVADRAYWAIAKIEAEARQQVLNEELSHRLKNTLAMVQAIAVQSLKSVGEREAVRAFEQRIRALSSAHDLLLQASWVEADLGAMITNAFAALGQEGRCVVTGSPIKLSPRATLSASLLIHELATNALKYGALSRAGGHVELDWIVEPDGNGGVLVLRWREIGGPPAVMPRRKGFGSRLIQMGLGGTGGARLGYGAEGFEAEFRTPLPHVQQD